VASTTTDGHAVTASIGVALSRPAEGEDVPEAMWRLVDQADLAMYEAKRAGRDRVAANAVPRAPRPAAQGRPAAADPSPTDVA
jgi:PleD family two-component response regulator